MSEPIHCDSCGIDHTDPRLSSPDDVSIDIVGNTILCPVYSNWITEALATNHDVVIRFLEAKHTLVIKGHDLSRLEMLPSGHTYYRGESHYCQEPDCPARKD